ncbi:MAG: enoyl-CoA hydratase [Anaerolineae bacterium]|nr:bifunctional enoyl-CoA hydratase/phosphate acetyltransferase [Anaerolineales bacterium]MCQ3977448.1 enoyl-CoA hydratase [Anaerolineae bacterium]
MDYIENRTFDEIEIGQSASLTRTLTREDIQLFAIMSGDISPIHVDEEYAKSDMFNKIIAHGMWGGALISTLLGTKLPGPGTIYLGQTLRFRRPVAPGDTITVTVTATAKNPEKHRITFECQCVNQTGEVVIKGEAEVLAPTTKVKRPRVIMPQVSLHDHGAHYRELIKLTEGLEPIRMAVVHPVDRCTLLGAIDAAQANLIIPVLVGPEAKIRAVAQAEDVDLSPYTLIPTEHSHAAAARAVAMARADEVDAMMKGALSIEELMHAVVTGEASLRTARRISHVAVMDVPTYPRPLFITDANINIYPSLEDKRDIVQNAIDLAVTLGIETPKVAILSAIDRVSPKLNSTMEAAALCKMADRGQISGGMVDGPLAFDDAISREAAQAKGLNSPVAGQADILVVPDLETGTLLVKQLEYLAEGQSADIVLGSHVPIALTDRADKPLSRLASCALAMLLTYQKRKAKPGLPSPIQEALSPRFL